MTRYVAGFLFSEDETKVLLITKLKPKWQAGFLNAIGGKIEGDETPLQAMVREFDEEAGVLFYSWQYTTVLRGPDFEVHFFAACDDIIYSATRQEDEPICVYDVSKVMEWPMVIPNLKVLIPIALDRSGITKPVILYDGIPNAE